MGQSMIGADGILSHLDALMRESPVGFRVLDLDLRFLAINPALAATNGLSVEEHLGRRLADVLPGLPAGSYLPVVERLLAGEAVEPFVMTGETPLEPGRRRSWQEAWHAVRDEDGTIVAVAALAVEVTEIQRLEHERSLALGRLAALQAVTGALVQARTRAEIADVVVGGGLAPFGVARPSMFALSEDGRRLEALAIDDRLAEGFSVIARGRALPAWEVVDRQEPLFVGSAAEARARWPELDRIPGGARPFFGVPLVVGGRAVGLFAGAWEDDEVALADGEVKLLEVLGQQLASAFQRAILFEAERRGRKRMKRLRSFAAALARATTVDEVAEAVVTHASNAAGATSAALVLDAEDDGLRVAGGAVGRRPGETWRPLADAAPVAQVIATGVPAVLRSLDEAAARFAGWRWLFEATSQCAWALWPLADRPGAALALGYQTPQRFTREQRREIETFALQCAQALARAEAHERERDTALRLQRSLLPGALPVVPGIVWDAEYVPRADGMEVGGDWYDAVRRPDGSILVSVGDVVGHGLDAAAGMGRVRNALAAYAVADVPFERMIPLLDVLVRETDELDFTTVALCRLGRRRRRARISLAGHPPPVVQRADRAPRLVAGGATTPLSTGIDAAPSVGIRLREGTRLVLYTDGLVERRGLSLDDGFSALLAACPSVDHPRPARHIVETMRRHGGGFTDDVVVLTATAIASPTDAGG